MLIRRLPPSTSLCSLVVSIGAVWVSFLIGYFWSRNKQYSFFYRANPRERFEEWPRQRHEDAAVALDDLEAYARTAGLSLPLFHSAGLDAGHPARLCVAILTTTRRDREGGRVERQYLRQTMAALLTRVAITPEHLGEINLAIYNLDDPDLRDSNPDIGRIARLVHTVPPPDYAAVTGGRWRRAKDLQQHPISFKENVDFLSVLQHQSTKRHCQHHLILEDDALARRDWYDHLKGSLNSIPRDRPWHYLKMFVSLGWFGWSWQLDWIVELILIGALGMGFLGTWIPVVLVAGLVELATSKRRPLLRRWLRGTPLWMHTLMILQGIGVAWMIGRQNLHYALPGIYHSPTYVFMVAVVYPRAEVARFAQYILHHLHPAMPIKDNHYPLYVADLIRRRVIPGELDTWIMAPDAFQHIGHHSSLHQGQYALSQMRYSTSFPDDIERIQFKKH